MKKNVFLYFSILFLIASLGVGLFPGSSFSEDCKGFTCTGVGWNKLPYGATPRILASAWYPTDSELYVIYQGQDNPNDLWLTRFNAMGDFIGYQYIPHYDSFTNLGSIASATLSWNPATEEMYLVIPDASGNLWATTVNSDMPNTKHTVSGKVTDQNGNPLSGAIVEAKLNKDYVKTTTDASGNYMLNLRDGFSYVLTAWNAAGTTQVGASQTVPSSGVLSDTLTGINFSGAQFSVNASVNPAGAGTVNGVSTFAATYNPNDQVMLTAAPNSGYTFNNWTEGTYPCGNSSVYGPFNITANRNFVANFTGGSPPPSGCSRALVWFDQTKDHLSVTAGVTQTFCLTIPTPNAFTSIGMEIVGTGLNANNTNLHYKWIFPDGYVAGEGDSIGSDGGSTSTMHLMSRYDPNAWMYQNILPYDYIPVGDHQLILIPAHSSDIVVHPYYM